MVDDGIAFGGSALRVMPYLMALIAQRRVGNRLGRIELRAVERRPKPSPPPTRPRAVIREAVRVHGHAKNLKQAPFEPDRFAFTRRHARIVASANSTSVRSTRTKGIINLDADATHRVFDLQERSAQAIDRHRFTCAIVRLSRL